MAKIIQIKEFLCEPCLRYYPIKSVGCVWDPKKGWLIKAEWGNKIITGYDKFKCLNCSADEILLLFGTVCTKEE